MHIVIIPLRIDATEQRDFAHALEMPQANHLAELARIKLRDFRQKERQGRNEAAHAVTLERGTRVTERVFPALRKRPEPAQQQLRGDRLPIHGKLQNLVIKTAREFHRLGIMLLEFARIVPDPPSP